MQKKTPRHTARPRGWRPERDEEVFRILRLLRGMKPKEFSLRTGLSPTTLSRWRKPPSAGGTRYPQHLSLNRALSAVGKKFIIVDDD